MAISSVEYVDTSRVNAAKWVPCVRVLEGQGRLGGGGGGIELSHRTTLKFERRVTQRFSPQPNNSHIFGFSSEICRQYPKQNARTATCEIYPCLHGIY